MFQLLIKEPLGLGTCLIISMMDCSVLVRLLKSIGKMAYELYLIHGYLLEMVGKTIFGASMFWILSFIISFSFYKLFGIVKSFMAKTIYLRFKEEV